MDSERIGIWETSYGGGLVLYVGTYDKRVKAVVSQVPGCASPGQQRAGNTQGWDNTTKTLLRDRIERYKTGVVNYVKAVAPPGEPCCVPNRELYEALMAMKKPNWRNQITLESLEKMREFDSTSMIQMLSPTALVIIAAEKDAFFPSALLKEIYEKALEPKAMSMLPIRHTEVNYEPWLSKSADLAINWYKKYL